MSSHDEIEAVDGEMTEEEKITLSQKELEYIVETRVQGEKLKILIEDFQRYKDEEQARITKIDTNLSQIYDLIRDFPHTVSQCRDELEQDIHNELERHYATKPDVARLRTDMETEFRLLRGRFTWTISAIVAVGGVLQFIFTIVYYTMNITGNGG